MRLLRGELQPVKELVVVEEGVILGVLRTQAVRDTLSQVIVFR